MNILFAACGTGPTFSVLYTSISHGGEEEQAKHVMRTADGTDMIVLFPNGPSVDRQTYRTFWEGAIVPNTLPPVQSIFVASDSSDLSDEGLDSFRESMLDLAHRFANATTNDMGAAGGAGGSQA